MKRERCGLYLIAPPSCELAAHLTALKDALSGADVATLTFDAP